MCYTELNKCGHTNLNVLFCISLCNNTIKIFSFHRIPGWNYNSFSIGWFYIWYSRLAMGLLHPSKSAQFLCFYNVVSKGQLISKGLVGLLSSSKKGTKKIQPRVLWYLRSTCFCSFFGRIEDTKKSRHHKVLSKVTDL